MPAAVYEGVNYVDRVSCKEIIHYLPDGTSTRSAAHSSFFIPHSSFFIQEVSVIYLSRMLPYRL